MLQLGFGQRNGLERSKEDAGRERVVLARDALEEEGLAEGSEAWDAVDWRAGLDGEGTREAAGVLAGVLAVEKTTAGGMQP